MLVTCVLNAYTDAGAVDTTKTLTLQSVDGTKVTAQTNATGSPPVRTVNADDLDRGAQNVNNVGLTVSPNLAMQAVVKDPANAANTVTIASHATSNLLLVVTIDSQARTLDASEFRDAIANCKRSLP